MIILIVGILTIMKAIMMVSGKKNDGAKKNNHHDDNNHSNCDNDIYDTKKGNIVICIMSSSCIV